MSSSWINWFRSAAVRLPDAKAAGSTASVDRDRVKRVLTRGNVRTQAMDLSSFRSLSPAERMIHWLKSQPADVVDAAAQHLNWSQAEEVLLWLVRQPATDAATAVKIFMRAEPVCYVSSKADDPNYDGMEFEEALIFSFVANWTANRYARGGVGYDPAEVSPYGTSDIFFINELNDEMAKYRSQGIHPLPHLHGLEGPFKGPKPKDLEDYLNSKSREEFFLVRYMYASLGTWITDDEINEDDFDAWRRKNGLDTE